MSRRFSSSPRARWACVAALAMLGSAGPLAAQIDQRFDLRIPMRDGVELSANVWMPGGGGRHPVVLVRTPYIKTREGYAELGARYAGRGYAFVVQDVRGRGDSDGRFDFFFADATDGFDTIEWVARQPWSNGKVGMVGGSYLASVQWLAARERPAALTCMIPQAPAGTYFNELPRIGGAWLMAWSLNWINGTSARTAQGGVLGATDWERVYRHRPLITMDDAMGRDMPLYNDFLTHSTLDDYWRRIHFEDRDFERIDLPVLAFSGWFDADQRGTMRYWAGMRDHSPAADRQHIIIGPWTHGGAISGGSTELGEMRFTPESVVDPTALHLDFFDYCLKGTRASFEFPRARVYLMGSNQWRDYDAYPPKEMTPRSLFLASGGAANSLAGDGRLAWDTPVDGPPDRYSYDPEHPVPAGVGGVAQAVDHRAIERRHDVLVYSTEALEDPVDIVGPVSVVLHAASDARDTDFTAKLLDVYPDGRAVKLGWWDAAVIRARYRNGYAREELLTPGKAEEYEIDLGHIGHTFLPGHRIRVEISSSAYPFIAPNSNTGNPIATDTESRVAKQTIYHDRSRPSRLVLPVVPRKVIP
ncbi:MAG: CocE/NonD family hydrolase [Gemmatimonadales bacterium]